MAFPNLDKNLTYAIRTDSCVLAGISTLAHRGGERSPFMGKIVDQRIFREPPRQILVDTTKAQQIAGAAILHARIEEGIVGEAERLADGAERGADDLVTAERRGIEVISRMLQHSGLQSIDFLQTHGAEIDVS